MSKRRSDALRQTVQDVLDASLKHQFTQKDLHRLGVVLPCQDLGAAHVKAIRQRARLSQAVFAQLLNVSASTLRQWEQGRKRPAGSAKVLLELLHRTPDALSFRIKLMSQE